MNAFSPVRDAMSLASEAFAKAADLVRLEVRLAQSEFSDKLAHWKAGAAMMLVAGVFAAAALLLILQAIVVALVEMGLRPSVATVIVAGISLVIAAICFSVGRKRLETDLVTPDRTLRQLSRDKDLIKEKVT